jgi:hypothetical protein
MTCAVCEHPLEHGAEVHPACVPAGLLRELIVAAAELIAVVVAPTVIVMAS